MVKSFPFDGFCAVTACESLRKGCFIVAVFLIAFVFHALLFLPAAASGEDFDDTDGFLCEASYAPESAPDHRDIRCRLEYGEFSEKVSGKSPRPVDEIIVSAYNMERGMFLEEQIDIFLTNPVLRESDIILASEADRGCSRTGGRNVAREFASALGMNYVYAVEFIELPRRSKKPVNTNETVCEHGNAVLSRYPILNAGAIRHADSRDWYIPPGPDRYNSEPRLGGRVAVTADIDLSGSMTRVYAVHFDSGPGRQDINHRLSQARELARHAEGYNYPVIIGGDFNTISYTFDIMSGRVDHKAVRSLLDAGFSDAHAGLSPLKRGTTGRDYGIRGVIDLMFVRDAEVLESGVCRPRDCGEFSDHLPVWTKIRLR